MNNICKVSALGLLLFSGLLNAQENVMPEGYITGAVTSANGPEAGVWVIAETDELDSHYTKIVVTDDEGRYVLPELPVATYNVWVRGYGLADNQSIEGRPGDRDLNLTAIVAPSASEAAQVYPGNYWLSLLEIPGQDVFNSPLENGFTQDITSQRRFIHEFKRGCGFCHQLGNELTRGLSHMDHLGFDSSEEAWIYRTQTGVRGNQMFGLFAGIGVQGMAGVMSEWTDRIEDGALPPVPPRPQGIERNVVITQRDIGGDHDFMHDMVSTDKNNPRVNAYGPTYAVSSGHGYIAIMDPVTNVFSKVNIPTKGDPRDVASRFPLAIQPSNFWGDEALWSPENPSDPHNPMMGPDGRIWLTSTVRNRLDQPEWCGEDSDNKYGQYYPLTFSIRQASVYDPATGEFELIDTCFSTHHLQMASDPDSTMYYNEIAGPAFGWVNTRLFDLTHDEEFSQGWCPQVIDTNGDGVITKPWNIPGEEADPSLDTEVRLNMYSVIPDPNNGDIVWGANETYPGHIIRLNRGNNPPETCISEVYQVPNPGSDPRGIDIDSNGVVWLSLAGSSHWARFDRNQCSVTSGPGTEVGTHCENGWTLYDTDGPRFTNSDDNAGADFHYLGWVDQHDVIGLGKDTPIITGSFSDSLMALDPESGEWTTMRVPYPLGFYHRGLDGRIDDPDAGWKGRSLWANYGSNMIWHTEGGQGQVGKMVQFQIRPDALAH
ncbi:MAG: carboxypeptidase-like regulatory domain-containing protein [Gammaproteobacteria bacterium]|jgi:hypothetical protein|nr:carboxypeptidase-like regulatory domain-containing protein [Gammaproteobacteria bacterium]